MGIPFGPRNHQTAIYGGSVYGGSVGEYFADLLWGFSKNLIVLKGGGTAKGRREAFAALAGGPAD